MNDFFEDEDESFYKDITFDTFSTNTSNKYTNLAFQQQTQPMSANYSNRMGNQLPNYSFNSSNYQSGLRIQSPAINASAIQINRSQASPGTQRRPPHLRLNNL